MSEVTLETARRLNSQFVRAHPQWGPSAAPFKGLDGFLGHFVSKIAFALDGVDPDYVSITFGEEDVTVLITASELIYLAVAGRGESHVAIAPFELETVVVHEAPNVMRSAADFEFDAIQVSVRLLGKQLVLPGHRNDGNEEALVAYFPTLVKHLKH